MFNSYKKTSENDIMFNYYKKILEYEDGKIIFLLQSDYQKIKTINNYDDINLLFNYFSECYFSDSVQMAMVELLIKNNWDVLPEKITNVVAIDRWKCFINMKKACE